MDLDLGDTRLIIDTAERAGLLRNQLAYVLATAYWETARTMRPVREYGGEKYLRAKDYYPYVGMGYVQLTWRRNYEKASMELGVDFVSNPRLLLEPKHAAKILVIGMVEGWFTGRKLSDYITLDRSDFIGARKIVNGTDKAAQIAKLAKTYDALLRGEGYGEEAPPWPDDDAPDAIDQVLNDADKPLGKSSTAVATGLGAAAGASAAVKKISDNVSSVADAAPWLLVAIVIAGTAWWILRERKRKAKAARLAKLSRVK